MVLMPFIENAFKHGLSADDQSIINIDLHIESNVINLKVNNTICSLKNQRENNTPGIGLQNVKKRLKLLYPERHNLLIEVRDNFFYVDLRIEL
jgi:sensor histidine kinase YesM